MAPQVRVVFAAVCWSVAVAAPISAAEPAGDEQILQAAGIATDGLALLDFFRRQTATTSIQQREALIQQLGADSFPVREKASADLVTLGPVVVTRLRQTIRETPDIEVRRRAACVEQIQTDCPSTLAAAAARVLTLRKPAGAAETLLAFLPGPYDDSVIEEVHTAPPRCPHRRLAGSDLHRLADGHRPGAADCRRFDVVQGRHCRASGRRAENSCKTGSRACAWRSPKRWPLPATRKLFPVLIELLGRFRWTRRGRPRNSCIVWPA